MEPALQIRCIKLTSIDAYSVFGQEIGFLEIKIRILSGALMEQMFLFLVFTDNISQMCQNASLSDNGMISEVQ